MSPFNANNTKGETVYATGNSPLTPRKIVAVSVYLPPSMSNAEVETVLEDVVENVDVFSAAASCKLLLLIDIDVDRH